MTDVDNEPVEPAPLLACPQFFQRPGRGKGTRISCKVCGYIIAEQRGKTFWRSRMYVEIKIRFADTTCHITSICKTCVAPAQRNPDLLLAIYHADIDDQCIDEPSLVVLHDNKLKPKIVNIDASCRGMK